MKKSEFIASVAEKAEMSRAAAARVVDAIFDTTSGAISDAVRAGGQLSIPGFGKFRSKTRPARQGRNPRTGATIDIPEKQTVAFSAGRGLQDAVAGKATPRKRAGGAAKKAATKTAGRGATKTATKSASKTTTKSATGRGGATAKKSPAKKSAGARTGAAGGASAKK